MKIVMRCKISGTRDGADWPDAGGFLAVSDVEGAALCAQGLAVPAAAPAPEDARAATALVENAAAPKSRTRKA